MSEKRKEIIPVCSVCYIPNLFNDNVNGVRSLQNKAIYYQDGKELVYEGMKK